MESLEFDGKKYVKVSSAARETGYTTDYIGQLCRAKKIDAHLVGRTWYVAHEELHNHRRTRGRSSHEKARQQVREDVSAASSEVAVPIHVGYGSHTRHSHLLASEVRYHNDESELIPLVEPPTHVEVTSTDVEENVPTDGEHERHVDVELSGAPERLIETMHAVKPTEVKWNGTIVVEPLEQDAVEENGPDTLSSERHVRVREENERNNKIKLDISDVAHDPLEAKQKFLERMNLAHALNHHSVPEKARERTEVTRLPNDRHRKIGVNVTAQSHSGRKTKVGARIHPVMTSVLATASVAGILFALGTAFVETPIEYRSSERQGLTPVVLTDFDFTSVEKVKNLLSANISDYRDILKLKR